MANGEKERRARGEREASQGKARGEVADLNWTSARSLSSGAGGALEPLDCYYYNYSLLLILTKARETVAHAQMHACTHVCMQAGREVKGEKPRRETP